MRATTPTSAGSDRSYSAPAARAADHARRALHRGEEPVRRRPAAGGDQVGHQRLDGGVLHPDRRAPDQHAGHRRPRPLRRTPAAGTSATSTGSTSSTRARTGRRRSRWPGRPPRRRPSRRVDERHRGDRTGPPSARWKEITPKVTSPAVAAPARRRRTSQNGAGSGAAAPRRRRRARADPAPRPAGRGVAGPAAHHRSRTMRDRAGHREDREAGHSAPVSAATPGDEQRAGERADLVQRLVHAQPAAHARPGRRRRRAARTSPGCGPPCPCARRGPATTATASPAPPSERGHREQRHADGGEARSRPVSVQ